MCIYIKKQPKVIVQKIFTNGHPGRVNNSFSVGCCNHIRASQCVHEGESLWFSSVLHSYFTSANNIDLIFFVIWLASRFQTLPNNTPLRPFLHHDLSEGTRIQWGVNNWSNFPMFDSVFEKGEVTFWGGDLSFFSKWCGYYMVDLYFYLLNSLTIWFRLLCAINDVSMRFQRRVQEKYSGVSYSSILHYLIFDLLKNHQLRFIPLTHWLHQSNFLPREHQNSTACWIFTAASWYFITHLFEPLNFFMNFRS